MEQPKERIPALSAFKPQAVVEKYIEATNPPNLDNAKLIEIGKKLVGVTDEDSRANNQA